MVLMHASLQKLPGGLIFFGFSVHGLGKYSLTDLILGFLGNASDNCAPGTYVCVGITTHSRYMHEYQLKLILGDNLDICTLDQYEFLGVDDVLIKKLLSYGYIHQGGRHIHNLIKDYHVTLVFKLKDNIENCFTEICS